MEMIMSDNEIRRVANMIAEIVYPQLEEAIKTKAKWTVSELSQLQGQWLSVKELSIMFSVSELHIRNLIDRGMPHFWVGNTIRVEKTFIQQAIKEGKITCQK